MTKVNFDYSGLQNSVLPSIDSACANINNARNTMNNTFIPYDCVYQSYLRSLNMRFSGMDSNLKRVKNWIQSSNSAFENSIYTAESKILNTEVITINKK